MTSTGHVETSSLFPLSTHRRGEWLRHRFEWVSFSLCVVISFACLIVRPWPMSDFGAYYRAAVAVNRGENPYQSDEYGPYGAYRYAPGFAYLLAPLGHLDFSSAARIWFLGIWLCAAACFMLAGILILGPKPWPANSNTILLLAMLSCLTYIWTNMHLGQVALVMTLACLAWAVCQREGRNYSAGICLAPACALKLAPVVLIPYMIIEKNWRALLGLVIGTFVLGLVPIPWVGLEGTYRLHLDWLNHAQETQFPQTYRPGNQGVIGLLARMPWISNGLFCYSDANLGLLVRISPFLVASLTLAFYSWVVWDRLIRRRLHSPESRRQRDNLHLLLLFIFMTLVNPAGWRCNYVALILPCLFLAQHASRHLPRFSISLVALILVPLAWSWSLAFPTLEAMPGPQFRDEGWSLGIWLLQGSHFWTALFVGGICWWISDRTLAAQE